MSNAGVQRLERLLSRVQERRAGPRAAPAAAGAAAISANTRPTQPRSTLAPEPAFSTPPPNTGRLSKPPAPTPLEESMEMLVPPERPRETQPNTFEAKPEQQPDSDELFLDDFEPPPTIAPPAVARTAAPARAPIAAPATIAPAAPAQAPAAVAQPAPAAAPRPEPAQAPPALAQQAAPITSATARIVPAAPVASAAPVATVSQARSIEPKSFGELLDLSLALRPAK